MDGKKVHSVVPELIQATDDAGKNILCPTCGESPYFINDDSCYIVSCECEAAFIKKNSPDNIGLTRQDIKNFLFDKWLEQVFGVCPPWQGTEEPTGWN